MHELPETEYLDVFHGLLIGVAVAVMTWISGIGLLEFGLWIYRR